MGRGEKAFSVAVGFTVLSSVLVTLRCISRFGILKHANTEDYLIILSMLSSIVVTISIALQAQVGLGKHIYDLPPQDLSHLLKFLWISIIAYGFGLMLAKDSILFQYQRLFIHTIYRNICWVVIALVTIHSLTSTLVMMFGCKPISFFWNKAMQDGKCFSGRTILWFFNAAYAIFTDLVIVALPLPVLRRLNLPKGQKYGLMIVFALGGFGCITSIVRMQTLFIMAYSKDPTWDNVGAATWSSIELNVGIVCACLPTIRPVIKWLFPGFLPSAVVRMDTLPHIGDSDASTITVGESFTASDSTQQQDQYQSSQWKLRQKKSDASTLRGDDSCLTNSLNFDAKVQASPPA